MIDVCKSLFKYDESSPSKLVRVNSWQTGRNYSTTKAIAGSSVGWVNNTGYWDTEIEGKTIACHRVIVALFGIEVPFGYVIDHINRDRSDNTISNLRVIPFAENIRNLGKRVTNTSGITGVSTKRKNNSPVRYQAIWKDFLTGKQAFKYFPLTDKGFDDAILYRHIIIMQQNASGAGYSDNHGK